MKIGFIHYSYPGIGGTETVTSNLASYFETMGHHVCIISWIRNFTGCNSNYEIVYLPDASDFNSSQNNRFIEDYADKHLDCIINQGPFWTPTESLKNSKTFVVSVLHYAPDFKIEAQKNSIQEVFENRFKDPYYLFKATIRHLFKNFFAKRDFDRLYRAELNSQIENSDKFVVLCDSYISQLNEITRKTHSNVIAIPNGLKLPERNMAVKENLVVCIGRLTRWDKRVDRLLMIWSKIWIKHPDWKLQILGDGPDRNRLQIMATDLGLKNCYFEGFVDITEYLKKASVLCMTSSSEGFPMVLLEAMGYGVIPVAYNVSSGIEYIVDNGTNGYIVSPFNEDMYVSILDNLLKNKDNRLRLSKNALSSAAYFPVEKMGQEYLNTIQSGINEGK